MSTSPSRLEFLQAKLAETRQQRVRQPTGCLVSDSAEFPPLDDTELLTARPRLLPRWVNRRLLVPLTAVAALCLFGYLAVGWWNLPTQADVKHGELLFTHNWEPNDPLSNGGDGLGPVFNARSCVECHFQGGTGGGGGLKHNVAAIEVLPTEGHPYPLADVVHAFAIEPGFKESMRTAREAFPIIPKGMTITAVCRQPLKKDYDPLRPHSINTPTLFGSGAIDRISDVAIKSNHFGRTVAGMQREFHADFTATHSGRVRVLPDGRIGKFGWKAQFATLEEFVANACAVEIGLTTPTHKQRAPKQHREDESAKPDMSERQFNQLVAFVSHLPMPKGSLPEDPTERERAVRGRKLFATVGCADCHTPDLGGATGVYSDFCLHDLTDHQSNGYIETPDVPVPPEYPQQSEWKTPPLWGVAQTAPYLHDGSAATLTAAIEAHAGQARNVREKFRSLAKADKDALLQFLETLTVE